MSTDIAKVSLLRSALDAATSPAEVRDVEAKIAAIENYMRRAGLYSTAEIRPVNESLMFARWKLGRLLADVDRAQGARTDLTSAAGLQTFADVRRELGLTSDLVTVAQRIGTLPESDLQKAFADAARNDVLMTYDELVSRARPHWYKAARKDRHEKIADAASARLDNLGPFPLVYADPPWQFGTYSDLGKERSADRHYPVLSDSEIIDFPVEGVPVAEIAHRDAALFLWATSSNLERALAVMAGWGFAFKSSAVWVKDRIGTGYVFRNQHELLLYGTRGSMPAPQFVPSSVFVHPTGEHSAKPPEIRQAIERMYPDFDASTRLELFTRSENAGWTGYGFENRQI